LTKSQAKELDALLADTRDISKAAIEAANAYKNIVDSIEKGLEASRDAVRVAESAIETVFFFKFYFLKHK
jgi:hypothetical protein